MRKFLLLVLAGALGFGGCQQSDDSDGVSALELGTPTKTEFDHRGGLGSVEAYAGTRALSAASSAPEWCRVTVFDRTVAFNVDGNRTAQSRTATITVSAEGLPAVQFDVTQDRLKGVLVAPTALTFSDDLLTIPVGVTASCGYRIEAADNPDETFSWTKSADGTVVEFTAKEPGLYAVTGDIRFIPEEGEEAAIQLTQPRKPTYNFLLGEWEITRCDAVADTTPTGVEFVQKEKGASYYLYFKGIPEIEQYPVEAEFKNGTVIIRTAQQLGNDGRNFYTLHYNGTIGGSGNWIFNLPSHNVAWAAEPLFDNDHRRITLSFSDNGDGLDRVARTLAIFQCNNAYFQFGKQVIFTTSLDLATTY